MALIIETGSGDNAEANSYATEAQMTAYADARGVTVAGDAEQLLLRSMDYAESMSFAGMKASRTQPLQWPRKNVQIDGYPVASDAIPAELVRAQIVTALAIDDGRDPMAAIEPGVKSETFDVFSTEYQDGAGTAAVNVDVSRAWAKLIGSNNTGFNQLRVVRV